jgi:hypothetical protein
MMKITGTGSFIPEGKLILTLNILICFLVLILDVLLTKIISTNVVVEGTLVGTSGPTKTSPLIRSL